MENPLEKFTNALERGAMKAILDELKCPPDIEKFFDCMVKNGCPAMAVLNGIIEFAGYLKEKNNKVEFTPEQFEELIKGTNIQIREEE